MPNIYSGSVSAARPSSTLVGTSSTSLVGASTDATTRVGLVVVNSSDSTIYLGLGGGSAVLRAGIALNPNGGVWVMDEYTYTKEAITAIAHTAGSIVSTQEFFT